ncbi:chemotaxis protein CheA [Thermosulfuriphilus ammonigenes]|uniref:Chemotaxis protein CheA n=1 Tax=Thermosulfuriphilus ammonigenes TaxID=1936021 RepID=A0A6G7PVN5_9BACT|nr:chemotaxis protein CheA [Thermosulfuriphilus ammonigenes]MBA2848074.1 two-component system chemotaxis sensor kinase CheA [Thermosulfuriphilus ammonigenes]QIJ71745.1 chemotaxis protein CheA [Thermosulfuriphilus ammonigenes]
MQVTIRADELDVLRGFLEEAWEHLDGIEDKILELEEHPDPETVNAIFRPIHTIKGTAAFLGLNDIKQLCHQTETLLDLIRKNELGVNSEVVDVLLNAVDLISQMLRATEEALEAANQDGEEVVLDIAEIDYQEALEAIEKAKEGGPTGEGEPPQEEAKLSPAEAAARVQFPPEMEEQFREEAEEHLANVEKILLRLESGHPEDDDLNELFRSLHTLKGNAGVLLSTIEDEALARAHPLFVFKEEAHRAEELVQRCRDEGRLPERQELDILLKAVDRLRALMEGQVESSALEGAPKGAEETPPMPPVEVDTDRIEVLLNALSQAMEAARVGLEEIKKRDKRKTALAKVGRAFELIIKIAEKTGNEKVREEAEKSYNIIDFMANNEEPEDHEEILIEGIKEGFHLFEELKEDLKKQLQKEAPKSSPAASSSSTTLQSSKKVASPGGAQRTAESKARQVIKVPQERLDKLMNLVGELVVSKNNFSSLAREVAVDYGLAALAQKIKEFGDGISRLVDELQATIMSVRMVPVSQVFSRFPRMIRDLSKKLGKKMRLEISGEETELDKTIIESLGDPLVHLIRNAADHGLEPPEERRQRGKPEEGTIWLRAYNKGQSVIIEIEDDGRGIDPHKIRAKALERGLLSSEELERLDDREIINLIFRPGFSTAEKVSEVSGRGVGMDVVRTAIERIGGSVELESRLGEGTKIILKLPLTLAISKGLEVETAGERYYIPLDYVVETVKAPREAIHWHRGQALVLIRGYLLPLFDLAELLDAGSSVFSEEDSGEIPLVVLNLGAKKLALKVDRFYNESEFVLKPLTGLLEGLTGFSGATVTGEGRVLLVLDPPKLIN